MNDPARVLVIQTAYLGDLVLTTPLLKAVKARWPACRVAALVIPETAAALAHLDFVDEIIIHDKRHGGLREFFSTIKKAHGGRFDVVLSPHRSARSAALAFATRAAVRVGFRESAVPWAFTHRVRRPEDVHEAERILALGAVIGIIGASARPALAVTPAERARATALARTGRYAVVSPASVWPTKRWTAAGFARVCEWFADEGLGVVLTGAPGEEEITAAVAAEARAPVRDLGGKVDVRTLLALIAQAAVVVANDSAPVHIAAAFDVPTVAIFGATVPAQGFAPLATRRAVAEVAGLPCRPCGPHGGKRCPKKHFRCMNDLSAAAVIAKIETVMKRTAAS